MDLMRQESPKQRATASILELTVLMTSLALSPVVIFLRFHGYRSMVGELALIAAVALVAFTAGIATRRHPLVRAALVAVLTTWLVDIGFNVNIPVPGIGPTKLLGAVFLASFFLLWFRPAVSVRIGTAIAATILGSSLLTPPGRIFIEAGQTRRSSSAPLFVHIVLDEHLGIAGLQSQPADTAIAGEVRQSLERAGFRVFGRAYSQDMWTHKSLTRLFNPTVGLNGVAATSGLFDYELTANEYFDRLARDGYALHVLQTVYLNLCPTSLPAACHSYDFRRVRTAEFERLPVLQRLDIMLYLLAGQSDVWNFVRRFVNVGWGPEPDRSVDVSPMSSMDTLDDLGTSLSRASAGEAYFAHVGLPHHPYGYDRDCRVRPEIDDWLRRGDSTLYPRINTADGRLARYEQYVGQVRCVVKRVNKVLAAIPDALARDAIIIIQGDHGSRITEFDPGEARARSSDFVDEYSALFAVRAPGIPAGYQQDQVSLTCLFHGLLNVGFRKSPDVSSCGASEPVFTMELPSVGVMPRMDAAP
jgi:hypothetical protein